MKRKHGAHVGGRPPKRSRDAGSQSPVATTAASVDHPVLARIYPELLALRHYLLSQPSSSKNRRRRILQLGRPAKHPLPDSATHALDVDLARLLDTTLVAVPPNSNVASPGHVARERERDLESFSQERPYGTAGATFKEGYFLQSEIVDFVIWRAFKRANSHRPSHLLCHGFQRYASRRQNDAKVNPGHQVPGMVLQRPNTSVEALKGPLWCRLHALLGQRGQHIMIDLLSDCAIFCPVDDSSRNYTQMSGIPLSEVKLDAPKSGNALATTESSCRKPNALFSEDRKPGAITIVRGRMFYARAALNAKGGVRFGMRHIHVLNRFPDLGDRLQTIHILRYMFPRQFGMHNVFTSRVDSRETAMPFKDYTLREKEIHHAMERELTQKGLSHDANAIKKWKSHIPKRLRGDVVAMVDKMRKLNSKCSYMEMLRHYCPIEGVLLSSRPEWRKISLQPDEVAASAQGDNGDEPPGSKCRAVQQPSFTDMACPTAHVSAFCRAIIARVIPNAFWGNEDNKRIILYWVDEFVCMRRFESLNLHQVTQKIQISTLAWLRPPGQHTTTKMAKSDFDKRQEIFLELVYWLFDSFLIPLIRTNFHVTESNVHRNRLFYFRHDVWRMLTEPSLATIKTDLFEELPMERAARLLSMRTLGFSKVRLLPKTAGVRMITNLKRRPQVMRNGSMVLGRSINSVMGPVFNILNYEKSLQPDRFGSSLFSVGDMFPKLASFRQALQEQGLGDRPLYFAKVDVQSCFDTIPQQRLLSMVESLVSMDEYRTGKHVQVSPLGHLQQLAGQYVNPAPLKRYLSHTNGAREQVSFDHLVRDKLAGSRANTVFVNTSVQHVESRDDVLYLLREHVERNIVKIGKRYYRQKTGIPQGSVLSSILCNFFYAELEQDKLSFALQPDTLLLRLLDDFCLISARKELAERFVQVMHRGSAEYGVSVKASKSLTNFDTVAEGGYRVPRSVSDDRFPYCGVLIDTRTLEVRKNTERSGQASVVDSLTVDLSKAPGQTFHRRTLNAFKMQMQAMFVDTSFNRPQTVLANLFQGFHEAAVRSFEYMRRLSKARRTQSSLLIKTVDGLAALAFVMLQRRRTRGRWSQNVEMVRRAVSRRQVQWLACKAFKAAFQRRQTQHGALLSSLEQSLAAVRPASSAERRMLDGASAPSPPSLGLQNAAEVSETWAR